MCVSNEPKSFCSGTAKYAVQKVTKSCANTKSFLDFRTIGRKGEKVKMMDEKEIMPYNFFKYGGVYTGEHHGMRYLIKNTGEKRILN